MLGLPLRTITSRHNPLVATFRAAVRAGRPDRRLLVLDGTTLIDDAVRAGVALEVVVLSIGLLRRRDPAVQRLRHRLDVLGIETVAASATVIEALSPVRSPGGAVALAAHTPIDTRQVFARPGPIVVTVGVQDPGNVGAIIRAADAADAAGVNRDAGVCRPVRLEVATGSDGQHVPVASRRRPLARRGP